MTKAPMRDGYGKAILELAEKNDKVIIMDADVAKSTRTEWVKDKFPKKFIDMGIAEQDMVGTAAGLAISGMIPFATTYCVFLAGRAFDQIRTTICYQELNVKLAGAHAGISVGPDGATHQALEDIACMSSLPNMTVIVPCDAEETRKATLAMAKMKGPAFIRFGRESVPDVTSENDNFEIGKANVLYDGNDIAIFANGAMVHEAVLAREILKKSGIDAAVINMHTVKPLDKDTVIKYAEKCKAIVTSEEHQKTGGLGYAISACLAENKPTPIEFVAVEDTFGESGKPQELMEKYGLTKENIVKKALDALSRKEN